MLIRRRILTDALFLLLWIIAAGCDKFTSPSPLDGIWLVESVDNRSALPIPVVGEGDVVYWEFQNVLFRITYRPAESTGLTTSTILWGYPSFERDYITFVPDDEQIGKASFPVPGGAKLPELRLRYETAHGRLTLFGEDYTLRLVRR